MTAPTFSVRDIPVYGDALLAPMDGYSDWPFRSICRQLGSAMSYSEFVNADDILNRPRFAAHKFKFEAAERPMVFQLYGESAARLLEAALRVQELGPDIIDINMGCPAKSVTHRGCGVGLMRTPQKVAEIFALLSHNLTLPITGKMRLGWQENRNYLEIARAVEENGGALIAVHGRTKQQGYSGQADWDAIAEVKAAVKIPVIGNGDVKRVEDIARLKAHTGCDAVMIGRAAMQNPWIFARQNREDVPPAQIRATLRQHLQKNIEFYGEADGQRLFRKYAVQYLLLRNLTREERTRILKPQAPQEWLALLDQAYEKMQIEQEQP